MSKRFVCFQIPSADVNSENVSETQDWCLNSTMSYRAETRWSALCATLKEDILELLYSGYGRHDAEKIR